jgi:plasmid stabilization system protein ParE
MKVLFSDFAAGEVQDAAAYLDLELEGLGRAFEEDVRRAAVLISRFPESGSSERRGIRRILLHKFPYKLIYTIKSDHILIIAVAHQHRRPDYWVD